MTRPLFCRLFGHKPSTTQVWNARCGLRDGPGVWFDLHAHCVRPDCTANVQVGAFYIHDGSMRTALTKPKASP